MKLKDAQDYAKAFYEANLFVQKAKKNASDEYAKPLPEAEQVARLTVFIIAGSEIGLEPYTAVQHSNVIHGKHDFTAEAMTSVINRSPDCHYHIDHLDDNSCKLICYRDDQIVGEINTTRADALAKGSNKNILNKMPQSVLFSSAIREARRRFFSHLFINPRNMFDLVEQNKPSIQPVALEDLQLEQGYVDAEVEQSQMDGELEQEAVTPKSTQPIGTTTPAQVRELSALLKILTDGSPEKNTEVQLFLGWLHDPNGDPKFIAFDDLVKMSFTDVDAILSKIKDPNDHMKVYGNFKVERADQIKTILSTWDPKKHQKTEATEKPTTEDAQDDAPQPTASMAPIDEGEALAAQDMFAG